mgnify:CR=1 FL=1
MAILKPTENPVDVVRAVLEQKLLNPISGCDVDYEDVLQYLTEWPPSEAITDRVEHFKLWLAGDLPFDHTQH